MSNQLVIPTEIWRQLVLLPFCPPRDIAVVLATCRNLRSLRRSIVAHLLGELFQGPGAVNAIPWIEEHHKDDLENLGLIGWLSAIDTRAKSGAYRASSGTDFSMVLTPGGKLLAAGRGQHGVLGAKSCMNTSIFTEVSMVTKGFPGRIPISAVSCGSHHTLLLTSVGTVHSCGLGEYGRLGLGMHDVMCPQARVVEALLGVNIIEVAAGRAHSAAVSWEGEAFTWGWGLYGVLGHGDEENCLLPKRVDFSNVQRLTFRAEGLGHIAAEQGERDLSIGLREDLVRGREGRGEGGFFVTCVSASDRGTILGTRGGSVLVAGWLRRVDGVCEVWQLPTSSGSCSRVEARSYSWSMAGRIAGTVLDSQGDIYALRWGFADSRGEYVASDILTWVSELSVDVAEGLSDRRSGETRGAEECPHPRGPRGKLKCTRAWLSPMWRNGARGRTWPIETVPSPIPTRFLWIGVGQDGSVLTSNGQDPPSQVSLCRRFTVDHGVFCLNELLVNSVSLGNGCHQVLMLVDGGRKLLAWGTNHFGQLGTGSTRDESEPVMVSKATVLGCDVLPRETPFASGIQISLGPEDVARNRKLTFKSVATGESLEFSNISQIDQQEGPLDLLTVVDMVADQRDVEEEEIA